MSRLALSLTALLTICATARADDLPTTLEIGKPAPLLSGGAWAQGDPVTVLPAGRVSVVAFWSSNTLQATADAAALNAVYERYGANSGPVTVIGQNVRESDPATFATKLAAPDVGVKFPVRLDDTSNDADGVMAKTWLASGPTLPCAIVVDRQGVAVWCGPWGQCPGVVGKVLAGTFDPATHEQELTDAEKLTALAKASLAANDFKPALEQLARIESLRGEPSFFTLTNRFRVLLKSGEYDAAYRVAADIEHAPGTGPAAARMFNELALIVTDTKDLAERDLIAAKRWARRAIELSNNWPGYANTLARAYFVNGEFRKAVETETDAASRAPERMKAAFEKTVVKYQAALDAHPDDAPANPG